MIELAAPRSVLAEPISSRLDQMKCGRCGQPLARMSLVVGSVVEMRCHHSIRKPNGKRETCGYVTRVAPTR